MEDKDGEPPRKVGSLRDRIAQFEQKPAVPPPTGPKPTPKQWAWKTKQQDPPAPAPTASATRVERSRSRSPPPQHNAFSASDAREAISGGGFGSLKERMAALQGKAVAGQPAPPPKPKKLVLERAASPPPADDDHPTEEGPAPESKSTEEAGDDDEEERARRARIAERMAKVSLVDSHLICANTITAWRRTLWNGPTRLCAPRDTQGGTRAQARAHRRRQT
ncbi:hypothetical protein FRC08_017347 [Ceratobasidium sp. 394]|nr:hypothetical protein FRC08_017347 [Ceratobasidium sp. 394]